jgi:hypothetical protein
VRYGGARPSCALGLLWIGVADLVASPGDWAAVAVKPPVGPSSGGSMAHRTLAAPWATGRPPGPPMSVATQPGQRRRGAFPEASVARARSRIAMSAAGTRPIILTSMALLAGEEITRGLATAL